MGAWFVIALVAHAHKEFEWLKTLSQGVIRQKCEQTLELGLGQIRYSSSNY